MKSSLHKIIKKVSSSSLFKDSFWAVFGNGLGNFLLLISGIVIARFLGKDIYGEYGVVKTTMFHIASFATLGLGFTSTRFVAKYKNDAQLLKGTIYSSLHITLLTSLLLCLALFIFSTPLAVYLDAPSLSFPFKFLGIIIVVKALCTTTGAILGGNKNFKAVGINTIISGVCMLVTSALFTYFWGLKGSLTALLLSQLVLCVLNIRIIIFGILNPLRNTNYYNNLKDVLKFTVPVALQELSYTISQWGIILVLTKYASMSEVGLYTAAAQWYAIILFVPLLLSNVVLSYLSGASSHQEQTKILKLMLLINFLTTFSLFLVVFVFSDFIISFYGNTFQDMKSVMNILVFSTIFDCLSRVFQSNLISDGKNWKLFIFRTIRDSLLLFVSFFIFSNNSEGNSAALLAWINLYVCVGYFFVLYFEYKVDVFYRNQILK